MEEFFNENDLKSRFDFFNTFRLQKKKSALQWIFMSLLLVLFVVGVVIAVHLVLSKQYAIAQNDKSVVFDEMSTLQAKRQKVASAKKLHEQLVKEQRNVAQAGHINDKLVSLFNLLAKIVPGHTWIDRVSFDHKTKQDNSIENEAKSFKNLLVIKGHSLSSRETLAFYNKLFDQGVLQECQLSHFQKVSVNKLEKINIKKDVDLYSFSISGFFGA